MVQDSVLRKKNEMTKLTLIELGGNLTSLSSQAIKRFSLRIIIISRLKALIEINAEPKASNV